MTCLTLTPDVAAEAIREHVGLIVTHHPILFRAVKRLTTDSIEGAMLLELAKADVAVYSPHTAFDSAAEGVNERICRKLGLQNVRPLRPVESSPSSTVGGGRFGEPSEATDFKTFADVVAVRVSARRRSRSFRRPGGSNASPSLADRLPSSCRTPTGLVRCPGDRRSPLPCRARSPQLGHGPHSAGPLRERTLRRRGTRRGPCKRVRRRDGLGQPSRTRSVRAGLKRSLSPFAVSLCVSEVVGSTFFFDSR